MNEEKNVPITLGEKYMLTIREASIFQYRSQKNPQTGGR